MKTCWLVVLCTVVLVTTPPLHAQEHPRSPAEGYTIHIIAPIAMKMARSTGPIIIIVSRLNPRSCNA
jgi:hypothetical protein